MVEIKSKRGFVATVDDADAELALLKWFCITPGGRAYFGRNKPKGEGGGTIYLHRVIAERMGFDVSDWGNVVDHMNGDTLDNRRCNIRVVPRAVNNQNRKMTSCNTSGHMGVSFDASRGLWHAYIGTGKKRVYVGRFASKEEAAVARIAKEVELWGVQPQRAAFH